MDIPGALAALLGPSAPGKARQPPPAPQIYNALLQSSAVTTLDGEGNGIVAVGPQGIGAVWVPTQVAVSTSTSASTPAGQLYLGPLLPVSNLSALLASPAAVGALGGTSTADSDSIGLLGSGLQVPQGQALIFVWAGGDVGATATMTVTGSQQVTYWK